ncbi:MAG: marine proteobacterial sortase target protein [Acidobacteria bacterium]|nr:marine proteobacterial sortase target protein [Acidobacteriota bacterium]
MAEETKYELEKWIAIMLALLFLLPFLSQMFGQEAPQQQPVKMADVNQASLLIKTAQPGVFLEAPAVNSTVTLKASGIIARGTLHQVFKNPTNHCIEALYVFPLPDNAAVDTLVMKIGDRVIEGQIQEKKQAQETYDQAKSEGKQAALVEQYRPNLFTASVASIPAGAETTIEIGYQQLLTYDSGHFSMRFPLAIGPRYGAQQTTSNALPAINHQPANKSRNPVTFVIDVDAGVPLQEVRSTTHAVEVSQLTDTQWHVTANQIASDRDFELTWTPRLGKTPHAAVFTETIAGSRHSLTMVFPPDLEQAPAAVLPRETVFIIDTSGSMGGPSIEQAKEALILALSRLRRSDSFNVIQFNSVAEQLFPRSRVADAQTIDEAKAWVKKLEATGGTEMLPALQLALEAPQNGNLVRQVIFMTDGQVSNEDALFDYIRQHLGNSRLFTVGIGAAPNSFFMRNSARFGRGTFTNVSDLGELQERMSTLFAKLEAPTLRNVDMQFDASAEVWPPRIPDLYAGEPLVVLAKTPMSGAKLSVRGAIGAQTWTDSLSIQSTDSFPGVAKLWARQKVEALEDQRNDEANKQIAALALEHHLVTSQTSLVAVDVTPAGVDAQSCTPELVPVNLPAGWGGLEAGALPQTGTNARQLILVGLVFFLLAALVVTFK